MDYPQAQSIHQYVADLVHDAKHPVHTMYLRIRLLQLDGITFAAHTAAGHKLSAIAQRRQEVADLLRRTLKAALEVARAESECTDPHSARAETGDVGLSKEISRYASDTARAIMLLTEMRPHFEAILGTPLNEEQTRGLRIMATQADRAVEMLRPLAELRPSTTSPSMRTRTNHAGQMFDAQRAVRAVINRALVPCGRPWGIRTLGNTLVCCNTTDFDRILDNLISNAVKHSVGGSIRIRLTGTPGRVTIIISNRGHLAGHVRGRLFERGHKGTKSDGHGVGMASVRHLVHQNGGSIKARCTGGFVHMIVALPASESRPTAG